MIVNTISNRINPTIISSNNRRLNAQLLGAKSNNLNSDSLQKQMSFMGVNNCALVNHLNKPSGSILEKYFQKLGNYKMSDFTILYRNSNEREPAKSIIFDSPKLFDEGIDMLEHYIKAVPRHEKFYSDFDRFDFKYYQDALNKLPKLKQEKIVGMIGQGNSNTAFLTQDEIIIKCSLYPNFPSKKNFIEDVDAPILERYIIQKPEVENVYIMKSPLTEEATLRNLTIEEYNKIWTDFYAKIKKVDPNYTFHDFDYGNIDGARQVGFIDDKPYLFDHETIKNRPIVW